MQQSAYHENRWIEEGKDKRIIKGQRHTACSYTNICSFRTYQWNWVSSILSEVKANFPASFPLYHTICKCTKCLRYDTETVRVLLKELAEMYLGLQSHVNYLVLLPYNLLHPVNHHCERKIWKLAWKTHSFCWKEDVPTLFSWMLPSCSRIITKNISKNNII